MTGREDGGISKGGDGIDEGLSVTGHLDLIS